MSSRFLCDKIQQKVGSCATVCIHLFSRDSKIHSNASPCSYACHGSTKCVSKLINVGVETYSSQEAHCSVIQGGEDPYDALSCRSFFAKERIIIGLFSGKWPMKIRNPMRLRHPVNYMTRSYWNVKMVFVVHPCVKSWRTYLCVYDTYSSIEIHIIYCHTFSTSMI